MEHRGIRTELGDINREIAVTNRELQMLRARIVKLEKWVEEESENLQSPTLADVITDILHRQGQYGQTRLQAASQMLIFLQENHIFDMAGLQKKVSDMYGQIQALRGKTKPIERRIAALDEHMRQAEMYLKHKDKKARTESEEILFAAAKKYLIEHLNGKKLNLKVWRQERVAKTAERDGLYREYRGLKDEVAKVEKIRKSVYEILRSEEKPIKVRDLVI
jgi:hypothetical protein